MKKSLALLGRLTGISPVLSCIIKKNESGIDVADLNTGICIMYTENIDNMIMSVKIVNNINI